MHERMDDRLNANKYLMVGVDNWFKSQRNDKKYQNIEHWILNYLEKKNRNGCLLEFIYVLQQNLFSKTIETKA